MTSTSEIKKNDYVVADLQGRPSLIRVMAMRDGTIKGKHEYKDQETDVEIDTDLVKANLGPKPEIGSVYGCKTERLLHVESKVGPFGTVEWYFDADADLRDQVHTNLIDGARLLKKKSLHAILSVCKIKVMLNTARKLTAKSVIGTYQVKGGSDDNPDLITVKYHADALSQGPRLLVHEAGHGMWHRLLTGKLRSEWVSMFYSRVKVNHVYSEDVSTALASAVREHTLYVEDEDEAETLALIIPEVAAATSLRWVDIETLLNHDLPAAKAVLKPWREYPVAWAGETETLVSDYAGTNPEEFWCESLSNYCTGVATPEYLKELLDKTVTWLNGRVPLIDELIPEDDEDGDE